jgi:hypothetical protein
MAKKHLNLLLLHCGTASQTISGLNVAVLYADDNYSATVFALFICI